LAAAPASVNLAPFATPSASFSSTRRKLRAINSGYEPRSSRDRKREAYDSWPHKGAEWLEYEWPADISTNRAEIYWLADGWDVALPSEYDLQYWNGHEFVAVSQATHGGIEPNRFNAVTFDTVRTRKLRLRFSGNGQKSAGVIQWRVWSAGAVPALAPVSNRCGRSRYATAAAAPRSCRSAQWRSQIRLTDRTAMPPAVSTAMMMSATISGRLRVIRAPVY